MKMTKVLTGSLLGLSLVLTGCGGDSGGDSNNGASPAEDRAVVEVFNIKTETRDQMLLLEETFEDLHPNIDINVTTVGGGGDAGAALNSMFASGNEPAIFMLGGLADIENWQHTLLDVSGTAAYEAAIEGTVGRLGGVAYGLPYNIEGFGWLVNKAIFEEAGIDIDDINSFEDFEESVRILDSKKDELGLDAVFGFSAAENWVISQFSSHFTSVAFGNDLVAGFEATEPDWSEADAFRRNTDLMNEFNLQPTVTIDYSTSVEDAFANGKVAIIHQGNWIVPTLDSIDPTFSQEKLGIIPMFIEDGGATGTIAAGPSWFWGINSNHDDEVIEAAKTFLDWMYTSEEGMRIMIEEFGFIPAYTGNDIDLITDPLSKTIYQFLLDGNVTAWMHGSYPTGWAMTVLAPEFQRYVSGESTWDDLIEVTTEAWIDMRSE